MVIAAHLHHAQNQEGWPATEEAVYYGVHLFLVLLNKTPLWVDSWSKRESYRKVPAFIDFEVLQLEIEDRFFESTLKKKMIPFFKKQQFMRRPQS